MLPFASLVNKLTNETLMLERKGSPRASASLSPFSSALGPARDSPKLFLMVMRWKKAHTSYVNSVNGQCRWGDRCVGAGEHDNCLSHFISRQLFSACYANSSFSPAVNWTYNLLIIFSSSFLCPRHEDQKNFYANSICIKNYFPAFIDFLPFAVVALASRECLLMKSET